MKAKAKVKRRSALLRVNRTKISNNRALMGLFSSAAAARPTAAWRARSGQ